MPQWLVRWHCISRILLVINNCYNVGAQQDCKSSKPFIVLLCPYNNFGEKCLKHPIIFRAAFYGVRPQRRIRWKGITRTTNGGSGNRKGIPTEHQARPAIGGAAAGRKTSTAPRKVGRTLTACLWNGAVSSPRLIPGTKTRWKDIATCCAVCASAASRRWSRCIISLIHYGWQNMTVGKPMRLCHCLRNLSARL